MLQAQIQQKSGVPTVKKPTERLPWPPKTTSLSSLDPAFESSHEVPARSSSSGQFVTSNRPQMQAGACTPIHSRISNTYNSPEASIPSNGGIKFHCENNLDLESSRLSNLPHSELLVVDFNSTHGFTNDLRADESQQNAPSRPEQASADDYEMANEDDETRSSMCFSFSDGKVTALVVTADGAYCIAGFSTGAIRLFDLTKGGNTDPEDRFGYQIGFIESNRGSVQVTMSHSKYS